MVLALPTQDTFTVGEILTSAAMNKNVRDAVNFTLNPPVFVGIQATPQTLSNAGFGYILLDTDLLDPYNGHSTTVSNQRYVAQVAGWYLVLGQIGWTGNSSGRRVLAISVNAAAPGGSINYTVGNAGTGGVTNDSNEISGLVFLNVGDHVELQGFQDSGASLALAGGSYQAMMTVLWVHA